MDPITGALVSSAVGAAGSLVGGLASNRSARSESRRNRRFQERMSNTAYQRAVKDMKAAGINPMLAAKLGGASSPAGSQATMQNAAKDAGSIIANTANLASQTKLNNTQSDNVSSQTALNETQNTLTEEKIKTERFVQALTAANAKSAAQNATVKAPFANAVESLDLSNAATAGGSTVKKLGTMLGDAIFDVINYEPKKSIPKPKKPVKKMRKSGIRGSGFKSIRKKASKPSTQSKRKIIRN